MVAWFLIVIIALVVIIIAALFYYYNRFVILENRIDNSLAQIDVQLKKRADLVPALVKVVKGYAKHEKGIMDAVAKARSALVSAGNISEKVKAGDALQNALGRLFAIAENYPNLKANENFLQLQNELSAIEDKVAYSRQYYNDSVFALQNASKVFPGVIFFRLFGRKEKEYLKISESEKKMPEIDL
ncbi:MAG: LemA family protein [Candidatus Nanoarchaeia archaeon]|nr:LemA family protein [Candidatus Nanoarchaeia archaeon]